MTLLEFLNQSKLQFFWELIYLQGFNVDPRALDFSNTALPVSSREMVFYHGPMMLEGTYLQE